MVDERNLNNGFNNSMTANTVMQTPAPLSSSENPALSSVQLEEKVEEQKPKSVLKIGRSFYALELFWQPLQDVDDPIPEIRETIESDSGTNLYTIHYGKAPLYGVARPEKGHKTGQIAAAVAVLDALSEKSSFVAVFKIEQGWWFVVARNDLILPEEDVIYKTEQEARNAFDSMMTVPDWGYKIAPNSWQVDGAEEMELEGLLKRGTQARLLSLSAIRGTKVLLTIGFIILALVALGVYSVMLFVEDEEKTPTVIEPIIPQVTLQPVEPEREEEKPWEKLVSVPVFLEKCWNGAYQLKAMQIPGWTLNKVVCTQDGISTGWGKTSRPASRVAWVEAALKEQYRIKGNVQINATGTSATIKIAFDDLPKIVSIPTLSLQKLRRELVDISQALSMSIPLTEGQVEVKGVVPPPPPGTQAPAAGEQEVPVKIYRYLAFSFSSAMDPPAWEAFFKPFAGLELTKIEYNPTSDSALTNNWKYEGRIYESEKKN
ncbi:MAG: hypothetical protein E7013_00755 [Alphaproteobacteria bacterium]|nr:hypothetical protein [Alphaproteobacteria bacterium]